MLSHKEERFWCVFSIEPRVLKGGLKTVDYTLQKEHEQTSFYHFTGLVRNVIRRRGTKKPTGVHAQRTAIFQLFPKIMALFTSRTNKQGSLLTSEHYFH